MPRRPGTGRGPERAGAFPQLRLEALAETGTQAVVGAVLGPLRHGETQADPALVTALHASQCLVADRGFFNCALWTQAAAAGAALVWRAGWRRDQDGVDMRVITYTLARHRPSIPCSPPGWLPPRPPPPS